VSYGARRAVAAIGVVVFLAFYVWVATVIADRLPDLMWVKLLYFAVVGTAWGLPLFPLLSWAERGGKPRR
jgi:hypothetical protein